MNPDRSLTNMKKTLTLDLNTPKLTLNSLGILSSPDLTSGLKDTLDVDTPTIESIILANSNNLPNTPSPSMLFQPNVVTDEQESFVGGFVDALNKIHSNHQHHHDDDSNLSSIASYDQAPFAPLIKEEPQTVPNVGGSPSLSPVDMAHQEKIKLERKRQRNRLAASKCRSRKLERISKLEDKVKILKGENVELGTIVNQLKEHVGLLKLEVLQHSSAGCQIILNQQNPY